MHALLLYCVHLFAAFKVYSVQTGLKMYLSLTLLTNNNSRDIIFTRSENSPFVYSCVLNSANLILKRLQEMYWVFPEILA